MKVLRLRDRLKAETERAIVEAAEHAFAKEGLASARMETVAARAGVAVGTLYNYFEDRAHLVRALATHRRQELVEGIDDALGGVAGKPFEAWVEAYVRAVLSFVDVHLDFFQLMMASEWTHHANERADGFRKTMEELLLRADRVIARGKKEAALDGTKADFYARSLVGVVRSVVMGKVKGHSAGAAADFTPDVVDLFLRGCGSPREARA